MPTDKKITELPVATLINASDVSVLVNSGADYQYTFTLLLQFLQSNLSTGANISFGIVLPQNTTGKNGDVFVNTSLGSFAQKISGTWTIVYTLPAANAADGTLLYGAGIPGSGTGKNSDSYINTLTGIFYKKSAGAWSQVFSMATGPQGPQGTAGTNGTNGTDGNTILFGTTAPSNTLTGINGNFYINTSNYTLFGPKTAGTWGDSVSLLAPGLPNGGATGQVLAKVDGTDFNTEWQDNSFANLSGAPADNTNLGSALAAKQAELGFIPENSVHKNAANGYAGLDGSGKVSAAQLPSYVDDVLEFANFAALPATGETGKIYVTLDTNAEYRWSGSTYIQIVASPGSTDAVTEGATNLYFTVARVLTTLLTGIGFSSATAVTATDTILGAIGKLQAQITGLFKIPTGGTAGQVLAKVDGTDGNVGWVTAAGGGGTATGSNGNIQFNDSGSFGADSNFNWNNADRTLQITGTGSNGGLSLMAFMSPTLYKFDIYNRSQGLVFDCAGDGSIKNYMNSDGSLTVQALNVQGGSIFSGSPIFNASVDLSAGLTAIRGTYNNSGNGGTQTWYAGLAISGGDAVNNFHFIKDISNVVMALMGSSGNVIIGGGTDEASALLNVNSTTKGFLMPRMTTTQKNEISSPAPGLVVYDTVLNKLSTYNGTAWEITTFIPNVSTGEKVVTQKSDGSHVDYETVSQYLADIDDSAGDKTSADLNSEYSTAVIGQRLWGVNNLYEKKTTLTWSKIPFIVA